MDEIKEAFFSVSEDKKITPMDFYEIVKFRNWWYLLSDLLYLIPYNTSVYNVIERVLASPKKITLRPFGPLAYHPIHEIRQQPLAINS